MTTYVELIDALMARAHQLAYESATMDSPLPTSLGMTTAVFDGVTSELMDWGYVDSEERYEWYKMFQGQVFYTASLLYKYKRFLEQEPKVSSGADDKLGN